jgi:hypothetical protein
MARRCPALTSFKPLRDRLPEHRFRPPIPFGWDVAASAALPASFFRSDFFGFYFSGLIFDGVYSSLTADFRSLNFDH